MDYYIVIDLEKKLLDPGARRSHKELDLLLSEDFLEFGTSGQIYDKKIILERLPEETPVEIEASDFEIVELANNLVQLRFKTTRNLSNGSKSVSLRSSIWKYIDQRWQLLFHQGTRVNE